jgi:hypothetical protein
VVAEYDRYVSVGSRNLAKLFQHPHVASSSNIAIPMQWSSHPDTANVKTTIKSFCSRPTSHRQQVGKVIGVTLLVCGSLYAQQATITILDAPGAGTGQYQGTFPTAINSARVITGYYLDANSVYHGFVLTRHGSFTSFDAPGAGNQANQYPVQGTQAFSINPALAIVGYYTDTGGITHCFLRAPNGTFKNIDPPGSLGSFPPPNGFPIVINPAGEVAGSFSDQNGFHGFLRTSGGTFISFDPPNSSFTIPTGINSKGAISGYYQDGSYHGFLRNPDGTFAVFDPPGSAYTVATGINQRCEIIGWYEQNLLYGPPYSFLRTVKGALTNIDFPGSSLGTFPYAINPAGTITGNYFNTTPPSSGQYSGFVRTAKGIFTSFDPPGSTNTTAPSAINPAGDIIGNYPDAAFVTHGFLRVPAHSDDDGGDD